MKDESRTSWGARSPTQYEDIKLGCLQRIADAVEKMSVSYAGVVYDRDMYKCMYEETRDRASRLARSNSALRGVIKRKSKAGRAKGKQA